MNYKTNEVSSTQTFSIESERRREMNKALFAVYDALTKKGYDPINQIVGYILSEDPLSRLDDVLMPLRLSSSIFRQYSNAL